MTKVQTVYRERANGRFEYWTYRTNGTRMFITADTFWSMVQCGCKAVFVK